MQQKKHGGLLVGGILPAVFGGIAGFVGLLCSFIGAVFLANPEEVDITVNGRMLEGEEAVEAAIKAGNVLTSVGGVMLIAGGVLVVVGVILLAVYFLKYKK